MDSVGSLGFWIFVAALVVGGMWSEARKKAEKHETLRRIVEKTGTIDEAKLKELFSDEASEAKPGYAYRGLRITGTILMFLGLVPAILGTGAGLLGGRAGVPPAPTEFVLGMLAISACIAVLGLGVFFSSRFAEPPPGSQNEPPAR